MAKSINLNAIRIFFEERMQNKFNSVDFNSVINRANRLGEGAEATCYKIPQSNYVLRVPLEKKSVDMSKNIDFNITRQDRVNHVVGKIDDCTILKYYEGITPTKNGLCWSPNSLYFQLLTKNKSESYKKELCETILKDNQENKLLNEFMPKISKDNIKKYYSQFVKARKLGMLHDDNGYNSIFNPRTGTLTAIDFYEAPSIKGTFGDPFLSFLNQCGLNNIQNVQDQNIIVKKALISYFEFILEHKIPLSEVSLPLNSITSKYRYGFKLNDSNFVNQIKDIMNNFNNNKSLDSIKRLIISTENL